MDLIELWDGGRVGAALESAGVHEAARKVDRFRKVVTFLRERVVSGESGACFVPGRIEVLGKHTDYAGGHSLLCAVSRGFCVVAVRDGSDRITVSNVDADESVELASSIPGDAKRGHWSNYVATVVNRLILNFGPLVGGHIAFSSDLPVAAGMSSSSGLVVAIYSALEWMADLRSRSAFEAIGIDERLADYLGCLENGLDYPGLPGTTGVGTTGGSEDHTAILCSRSGWLRQYRFAPTRFVDEVAMPRGYLFAIASSGVLAEKTGAALDQYNRAGARAADAARAWREDRGSEQRHLGEIVVEDGFDLAMLQESIATVVDSEFTSESLVGRSEQFWEESECLIPEAVQALREGDVVRFGKVVERSQDLAERFLENQIDETVHLVRSALLHGCVAASAFGAGFGGSVWALVKEDQKSKFLEEWALDYAFRFPQHAGRASFFTESPGPGVVRIQ